MESAPLDPSIAAVPIQIAPDDAAAMTPEDVPAAMTPEDVPAAVHSDSTAPTTPDAPGRADPIDPPPAEPAGWSDPITGTDGPRFWDRIIASESARARRYNRPVTVGLIELVGLERLANHWGTIVAERILVAVGRTIAREVRSSDHVARIEHARFGVLLTETDEVEAINCIERIREACELELGPASGDIIVGFGWASPPPKGHLGQAVDVAAKRLAVELRQVDAIRFGPG